MRAIAATVLAAFMLASGLVHGQTISQPTAFATLTVGGPETQLGQSFTATTTGVVAALAVRSMQAVTATLRIYQGPIGSGVPNNTGTPLYTQPGVGLSAAPGGDESAAGGFSQFALTTPFPVVAGQAYTFMLTATNPFQLAVHNGNPYAGGGLISQYGANPLPNTDLAFQVFEVPTYTVTPAAGANGSISPSTAQVIVQGASQVFTATPNVGYTTAWAGSTCPGAPSGNTFTAGPITGNCTVSATFTLNTYTVTPIAGANGSISPGTAQVISHGASQVFTATPNVGYSTAWTGTTCAGTPSGNTFSAGPVTANCTVSATFTLNTYTVTPSAGANGSVSPSTAQTLAHGASQVFTATPSAGFSTAWTGSTCAGTPSGNTFTAGPITGNCTVAASFTLNTYTVTPSAGANGSVSPSTAQTLAHGASQVFTATPNTGYSTAWTGTTCPGTPSGNTFTAGPITANCAVAASFTQNTYTVTPSAGANGSIAPSTAQTIAHGASQAFTATPNAGYSTAWSSTCPGAPAGNTFNAGPITASCNVAATFSFVAVTSYTAPSATGTGSITASFSGGGACTYAVSQFIPVAGHPASPPAGSEPRDFVFPHGLFDFRLGSCTPGAAIAMTITYPAALPPGTQYWKYGPTPGNPTPHWYVLPATIAGNTATFTITDGGLGDDDLVANGTIVDQGGPAVGPSGAVQTPTLSDAMLAALASLMLLAALRRRAAP